MSSYSTNEFKVGLKILLDGEPFSIVENEMVKPGKGQAFSRVKVRALKTGRVTERTWKSGDSVEGADVVDVDMQFLYREGDFWTFMVPDNYEQYTAGKTAMGEAAQWLKDGVECQVTLWNGEPLTVQAPAHVELKVVETDPGVRGDTVTGGQSRPSSNRAQPCACRCSSTKVKWSVAIRARVNTSRAPSKRKRASSLLEQRAPIGGGAE